MIFSGWSAMSPTTQSLRFESGQTVSVTPSPARRATINSDDPAYFGGYINANYKAAAEARGLGREQLAELARNSFLGAFLGEKEKQAHLARVDEHLRRFAG
jgi:hypothetical protein